MVKAKKEVVLAAGAVHTPQILQLSGVGPASLLDNLSIEIVVDLPGVGQNFQDHPTLYAAYSWEWFFFFKNVFCWIPHIFANIHSNKITQHFFQTSNRLNPMKLLQPNS